MQAIILAGGKGTRLAARLAGKPKPLVDVCGTPLLERQIRTLEASGVNDVIVLVNHAAEQIREFFVSRTFSATVRIVDDGQPRGTAGAVLAMLDLMAPRALVVYGDTLFDIDVRDMLAAHNGAAADVTLLLHPNDHPGDSDLVAINAGSYVSAFHPHPHPAGANLRNLVNAAFYIVEKQALLRWRDAQVPSDFGQNLFPAMVDAGQRLYGYLSAEYIKDLGTPARLDKVERHLASGVVARASRRNMQPTVFVDRDGTLNEPRGHIANPDDIALISGAAESLWRLNDAGLRTVLVTNQPVIARGEADVITLERIHGRLEHLLSAAGGYLDRIAYCPHHPDAGYPGEVAALKMVCECRKPATGMIEDAVVALNVERHRSWMVGDSSADILAAERAGLLSIRVLSGEGGASPIPTTPDAIVPDFAAAVALILDEYPKLRHEVVDHVADVPHAALVLVSSALCTLTAGVLRNELRAAGRAATIISVEDIEMPGNDEHYPADMVLILNWPPSAPVPATVRSVYRIDTLMLPERPIA